MNASPFYERKYTCPVCSISFMSLAVRSSAIYVKTKESDFRTVYKGINPLHYSIVVCPNCCYAASKTGFQSELPEQKVQQLSFALEKLKPHEPVVLGGERDASAALLSFQLAIKSAQLKSVPPGELAGLLHGAAWLSRELEDKRLETVYLEEAQKYYLAAYNNSFGKIAHMNEAQTAYIIGEIYRLTGKYAQAVNWYKSALESREIDDSPQIKKLIRDQWALAREQHRDS